MKKTSSTFAINTTSSGVYMDPEDHRLYLPYPGGNCLTDPYSGSFGSQMCFMS